MSTYSSESACVDSKDADTDDACDDMPPLCDSTDESSDEDDPGSAGEGSGSDPCPSAGEPQCMVLKVANGTARHGYVTPLPAGSQKRVRSMEDLGALCDGSWNVSATPNAVEGMEMCLIEEKTQGSKKAFVVPLCRLPKAMKHLQLRNCVNVLNTFSCACRRKCNRTIMDPESIRELRMDVFCHCSTEADVNEYLTAKLRATGSKLRLPDPRGAGETVTVCAKYYAAVHGIALGRLQKIRRKGKQNSVLKPRGIRGHVVEREPHKYNVAVDFWLSFFGDNCQRPNDEIRLFPTEKSYGDIYREYFTPWFERLVRGRRYKLAHRPKESVWKKARWDKQFEDVKDQKKHTHGRCGTCSTLRTQLLQGFADGAKNNEYIQNRRLHDTEVNQWRLLEKHYKTEAMSNKDRTLLIMHDGTSALGLPRLGRRTIKNLDPYRFEVVPWLAIDYTGNTSDYVYSTASTTAKNANTLISQVHAIIRRAKCDYNHDRHKARKLVLIADSASENKNNTLFAYCTDLVENKWFDEIELLFGPVGHTHNGVDAAHKIHNQNVASSFSGDLGHFVQNFPKGFKNKETMPAATLLQKTLDWTKYYKDHLRPIKGFTKSKCDPVAVRGFRIARNAEGTVDLTWKQDPAIEEHWRGTGGFPGSHGFFMLRQLPKGVPEVCKPKELAKEGSPKKSLLNNAEKLRSEKMKGILKDQRAEACGEFNYECAATGQIPVHRELSEETGPSSLWGPLCELGAVEGKRGKMRLLQHYWDPKLPADRKALWGLPEGANQEHIVARSSQHHFNNDASVFANRALPFVRYVKESRKKSEVALHPNNHQGAGWVEEKKAEPAVELSEEEDEAAGAPCEKAAEEGQAQSGLVSERKPNNDVDAKELPAGINNAGTCIDIPVGFLSLLMPRLLPSCVVYDHVYFVVIVFR